MKKRKKIIIIVSIIVIVAILIGVIIGVVMCNANKHTATKTEAKAATCTEDGNIEYWYCTDCEKYFTDEGCNNETTKADTVISATGHSYEKGICTACGALDPDYVSEGLEFESMEDGTCMLLSLGTCTDAYIGVPSTYNGETVIYICEGAFAPIYTSDDEEPISTIKYVRLPDTVELIGCNAFRDCVALESVTLGSGLKYIEPAAFENCPALTSVTFTVTEGWLADYDGWDEETNTELRKMADLTSEELSDPATAAKYLADTYLDYYWYIVE